MCLGLIPIQAAPTIVVIFDPHTLPATGGSLKWLKFRGTHTERRGAELNGHRLEVGALGNSGRGGCRAEGEVRGREGEGQGGRGDVRGSAVLDAWGILQWLQFRGAHTEGRGAHLRGHRLKVGALGNSGRVQGDRGEVRGREGRGQGGRGGQTREGRGLDGGRGQTRGRA